MTFIVQSYFNTFLRYVLSVTHSSPFSLFCNTHSCPRTFDSEETSKYSDVHEQSTGFEFLRALKWRGTRVFVTMIRERFKFFFHAILRCGAATLRVVNLSLLEWGIVYQLLFFRVGTVQSFVLRHWG